ncbi:hypothetical protein cypCar_00015128 [Cyprinus carpio]|nr:hypothetical protein cypCar_00015128 [Cyprinus carpio]
MRLYLAVFALLAAVHCEELFNGDQVLRINAESENHIQILKKLERDVDSGLDFWTHAVSTEQPVDIRVSHSSLYALKDFLKKNNIPFTVIINNVQEHLVREREEMVRNADVERQTKSFNFAAYHDLETIYNFMDTLVASHSNLITKVNIGSTYENRPMYVLKFSTGGEKKPAIWIDAGIHAREWISHATAVWLADRIATDFKENRAPVPSILSQMDIYLMIVANPDGYVFTHRSPNEFYRLWRKSRSATSNPKCHGVDLNRNWDAEFGGPGASDDPCAEDYRGPSAQSEIEVKNIADFIMSHGNFKSFMTLHSYKQLLMYPYGYSGTDAPDRTELNQLVVQVLTGLTTVASNIPLLLSCVTLTYSRDHSQIMRLYLAVFALLAAVHCEELFNGDQVLRINAESENHIQILKKLERDVDSGLDFWTHAVSTEQPVDIRVPHSSLYALKDFLKKNNIPFTVIINNVQEHLVREREEMVRNAKMESKTKSFNFAAYHDLETIYNFMDTLVANHSKLISKVNIGSTYENRSMYVLKFSTGGEKKPAIWIDAGIHAREWISHATAVWLADRIAKDFKENRAHVPSILSQMDIYLMIVANPDGYVFTHISSSPLSRFWCKSRSATSNPKCHGVDLNRNWDAEFGGPGASDDPCAEDYRGPSAQSEIEVKNIVKFIMSHGNFKSFMTLHSYMQLLMYPYGYIGIDAPDWPELHDVATKASKALNSWHGTVYKVGSIFHTIEICYIPNPISSVNFFANFSGPFCDEQENMRLYLAVFALLAAVHCEELFNGLLQTMALIPP